MQIHVILYEDETGELEQVDSFIAIGEGVQEAYDEIRRICDGSKR